jgi:hypothetical protein
MEHPILSPAQCEAIIELGSRAAGGEFDHLALSQLFVLELVTVRSKDRRLVLTERGRDVYDELQRQPRKPD